MTKILVQAATSTTSFDFQIIDHNNIIIYDRSGDVGKFVDNFSNEHVYNNFTVKIFNASADEDFTVLLVFKEIVY